MLTRLKKKIQDLLTSEVEAAHRIGFTPNILSAIGLILAFSSASVYAFAQNQVLRILIATILLLASGFCDTLDGILARNYEQESLFGGFLDSLIDRYGDAAVCAGIIIGGLCDPVWGLAALIGSMLVSYSRARAEVADIKLESIGIAERAERILIISIAGFATIFWLPALNVGIIALAVLSNLTVLQRTLHFYRSLRKKN